MACCLLPLPKSCCLLPLPKSKLTYHQQNPATLIRENFLKIYSHQSLNLVRKVVIFLTRPAVNIAVNKIDIWRVRCHLSRVHFTIVRSLWCHRQSSVTSSAKRKTSEWDTVMMCESPRFYVCTLVTNSFLCMYSCDELFMCSLECYFGVYFLLAAQLGTGNKHQNNILVST